MRKTERIYGSKVKVIRAAAQHKDTISCEDFADWPRGSTAVLLRQLKDQGELKLLARGVGGTHGMSAIYTRNEHA